MNAWRVGVIVCGILAGAALAHAGREPVAQSQPAARSLEDLSLEALVQRGQTLFDAGRMPEAQAYVQAALRRDPEYVPALQLDAELAWARGDYDGARQRWLHVLRIQRGDFKANFGLGRFHLLHESWRSAVFYLENALNVAPQEQRPKVLLELARAYRGTGERMRARETARQAVEQAPDDLEARSLYVALLLEGGELDEALVQVEKLVDQALRFARSRRYAREALQTLDTAYSQQIQVLRTQYQSLNERNPDGSYTDRILPGKERQAAAVLSRLIDVYNAQQELQRVLAAYDMVSLFGQRMVQLDPANPDYWLRLARLQRQAFQFAAAAASFMKVLELRPQDQVARQGATEALTKLLELEPNNDAAREQLRRLSGAPPSP